MAFSWTTVNDGTVISGAQWNEVKTNADTVISNLGIAAYSWSELPVTQGVSKFEPAEVSDLRAALDYAHDNNTCSAENASHNTTVDATDDTSVNAVDDTTVQSVNYVGDDVGDNVTYNLGEDAVVNGPVYVAEYNPKYTSYKTSKYSYNYASQNATYNISN